MYAVYLYKPDAVGVGRLVDVITDRNFPTMHDANNAAKRRWGKQATRPGTTVCIVNTDEEEWMFLKVENLREILAS